MNIHVARGLRCFLVTTAGIFFVSHFHAPSILMYVLDISVLVLCACYVVYVLLTMEDDKVFTTLISLSVVRSFLPVVLRSHPALFGNAQAFIRISFAFTALVLIAFIGRAVYEDHRKE